MSAEKGLAWFDLGDGRIVKGRAFWFAPDLPDNWEGREHLVKLERFEKDEIGLADWVDEQILNQEQGELRRSERGAKPAPMSVRTDVRTEALTAPAKEKPAELPVPEGPFKLDLTQRGRPRGMVRAFAAPAPRPAVDEKGPQDKKEAPAKGGPPGKPRG